MKDSRSRRPWLRYIEGGTGTGTGTGTSTGTGTGQPGEQTGKPGDGKTEDLGFPKDTPLAEMTVEQREAYWKDKARKHEQRANQHSDYDELKAKADKYEAAQRETMSEHEKAVEKAREEAQEAGKAAALAALAPRLVAAELLVAFKGSRTREQVATLMEPLDATKFLNRQGEVDTDKVKHYVESLGGSGNGTTGTGWPDMGQGHRQDSKMSAREKGKAEAARRFKTADA